MKPLITCIILNYNNTEFIYEAIESVLEQDYENIELAIFDDGSKEFPEKEITEYINSNKKENVTNVVVYASAVNEGTVRNINKAIQNTTGKYIFGMGTDDQLYNKKVLSKIVDCFEKSNADIITTHRQVIYTDTNNTTIIPTVKMRRIWNESNHIQQYKYVAMGFPIAGAGTFYARNYFDKYGLFDEDYRLQEDGPNFLRATREGAKFIFADIISIKYRLGYGVSSNTKLNPLLVEDIKKMFEKDILPYRKYFSRFEMRRIYYQIERIEEEKQMSNWKKCLFSIKYPDVIIYRKYMQ